MKITNKAGVLMGVYELVFDKDTPFIDCNSFKKCESRLHGKCMKDDPVDSYLRDLGYVPDMFLVSDLSSLVFTTYDEMNDKDREGLIWLDGVKGLIKILPR